MFVIVGLNLALDIVMQVEGPVLRRKNIARNYAVFPAGKAVNLSRSLGMKGEDCTLLGICGDDDFERFVRWLDPAQIEVILLRYQGATRSNLKIIEAETAEDTEFNSPGSELSNDLLHALDNQLKLLLPQCSLLVLTGSLPPGVADDQYAHWIKEAKKFDVRTVIDTSGSPLRLAMQQCPWMMKINWDELNTLASSASMDENQAIALLKKIIDEGTTYAVVTRVHDVIMATKEGLWRAIAPEIRASNPIGAGDALLSGLLTAWRESDPPELMLKKGTASAAASVQSIEPGIWDANLFAQILPEIIVTKLD